MKRELYKSSLKMGCDIKNTDLQLKELVLKKSKWKILKIISENILAGMAWNG